MSVGKEGEPSSFLTYADPEPFGIGYFGVCTGWGASGEWLIEGKISFYIPHPSNVERNSIEIAGNIQ